MGWVRSPSDEHGGGESTRGVAREEGGLVMTALRRYQIHTGDVLEVLRGLPDSSADACISDVPYGLGSRQPTVTELVAYITDESDLSMGGDFMGADWNVPSVAVWKEIFRVLKPGAPLFIFAGSRTYDLIALGMRSAGFEVKDSVMWLTGQGMPKPATVTEKWIRNACTHSTEASEPNTEHALQSLPGANLPAAIAVEARTAHYVQSGVPREEHVDSTKEAVEGAPLAEQEDGTQPGMEGRGHDPKSARKLRRAKVRPISGVGATDGATGRVHSRAPTRDGDDVGSAPDLDGGCTPSGSQSTEQRSDEPGVISEQRGTQKSRVACEACEPVAKRWEGYGHALRPSHEPVIVARKPLEGTIAENVIAHDVGGLNIKGCRLATIDRPLRESRSEPSVNTFGDGLNGSRSAGTTTQGRWPPNVIFTHAADCQRVGTRKVKAAPSWNDNRPTPAAFTGAKTSTVHHSDDDGTETVEKWECVEGCPVKELDEQSGLLRPGESPAKRSGIGFKAGSLGTEGTRQILDSGGTASRFFPCFQYEAKVDKAEREAGCERLPLRSAGKTVDRKEGTIGIANGAAGAGRTGGARNHHPCLKPIAVTTWLAKLALPPTRDDASRTILVPYCGSASEVIGALRAGWDHVVGIEREPDFVEIAHARIARWLEVPADVDPNEVKPAKADERQVTLFGATQLEPEKAGA